jgi:hypothetical protein
VIPTKSIAHQGLKLLKLLPTPCHQLTNYTLCRICSILRHYISEYLPFL